ncbi:MAG: hypothetical protein LLG02_05625 [Pelosinus sp.]|nr:hypothetical protein [Pelosinus sp.]
MTKMTEQQLIDLREKQRLQRKKRLKYVDLSIVLLVSVLCGFIYVYYASYMALRNGLICILVGIAFYYVIQLLKQDDPPLAIVPTATHSDISGIVMLNENGAYIKEWNIQGLISVIIGKNTKNKEVDIDLSNSVYDALIYDEHAIMNFAAGDWYLEGLHMPSSIGIKKTNDKMYYRLTGNKPCKVEKGDIVSIANTRLLLK